MPPPQLWEFQHFDATKITTILSSCDTELRHSLHFHRKYNNSCLTFLNVWNQTSGPLCGWSHVLHLLTAAASSMHSASYKWRKLREPTQPFFLVICRILQIWHRFQKSAINLWDDHRTWKTLNVEPLRACMSMCRMFYISDAKHFINDISDIRQIRKICFQRCRFEIFKSCSNQHWLASIHVLESLERRGVILDSMSQSGNALNPNYATKTKF